MRHLRPRSVSSCRFVSPAVLVLFVCLARTSASATVSDPADLATNLEPSAPQALGRMLVAGTAPRSVYVLSTGGYGYTESLLGRGDSHHRAAGSLAVEGRFAPWFGAGLRFDGRYDVHLAPGQPNDSGLVGDPRAYLRTDHDLSTHWRLGARLGVWLPGRNAPSVDFAALTPDLRVAATYRAPSVPLWVSANVGYRLDRSTHASPDAAMLSDADRSALGVSAFDQALVGLGAVYGATNVQGFLDAAADLLVGTGHPPFAQSPIWLTTGVRVNATARMRVEAAAEVSASARPQVTSPSAPAIPLYPRAALWLGLAYRFGQTPKLAPSVSSGGPNQQTTSPAPRATTNADPVTVDAQVLFAMPEDGAATDGALPDDLTVTARVGDSAETKPLAIQIDEATGARRFTVSGNPGEVIVLTATASGYEPAEQTLTLPSDARAPVRLALTLKRRAPSAQIRGVVRAFNGRGLDAQIEIFAAPASGVAEGSSADPSVNEAPAIQSLRATQGAFEIDVAPGSYVVRISARGFETQRRRVEVEPNGVTVLNVDLRGNR